jgi:hypothetical protein
MTVRNFELKLSRNFRDDGERRDYFKFPNKDSNGNPSTYQMNNRQMKEFEKAVIRRIFKNVIHIMNIGAR